MFGDEGEFTRAIEKLAIDAEPSPAHREALRERMLAAFEQALAEPTRLELPRRAHWPRRLIMHRRFLQVAASAAAACVIGAVVWWAVVHGGADIALADVRKHIESARTICYRLKLYRDGRHESTADVKYTPPGRMRSEMPGMIVIFDWARRRFVVLDTKSKTAHEIVAPDIENYYHRNWLEDLEKIVGSGSAEEVGEKDIAGRLAKGWRAREEDWVITIWADARTAELLQADFEIANAKMVMSDFEFGRELDESLFDLTPPKEYHSSGPQEIKSSDPSEKDLLTLLRAWAMGNGDVFPDGLDARKFQEAAAKVDWRRFGVRSREEGQAVSNAFGRAFYLLHTWVHEWSYVGKGVSLGDKDQPVFWHRPPGTDTYRVVYGDLSVKEVAKDELPEVPATEAPGN